jgi:hypothetical protein
VESSPPLSSPLLSSPPLESSLPESSSPPLESSLELESSPPPELLPDPPLLLPEPPLLLPEPPLLLPEPPLLLLLPEPPLLLPEPPRAAELSSAVAAGGAVATGAAVSSPALCVRSACRLRLRFFAVVVAAGSAVASVVAWGASASPAETGSADSPIGALVRLLVASPSAAASSRLTTPRATQSIRSRIATTVVTGR